MTYYSLDLTKWWLKTLYINEYLWLEKNIEGSITDGQIIPATTTEIFFMLKATNIEPPKVSLDALDIMKLTEGIIGGV